jgi:hypothetical protein
LDDDGDDHHEWRWFEAKVEVTEQEGGAARRTARRGDNVDKEAVALCAKAGSRTRTVAGCGLLPNLDVKQERVALGEAECLHGAATR